MILNLWQGFRSWMQLVDVLSWATKGLFYLSLQQWLRNCTYFLLLTRTMPVSDSHPHPKFINYIFLSVPWRIHFKIIPWGLSQYFDLGGGGGLPKTQGMRVQEINRNQSHIFHLSLVAPRYFKSGVLGALCCVETELPNLANLKKMACDFIRTCSTTTRNRICDVRAPSPLGPMRFGELHAKTQRI